MRDFEVVTDFGEIEAETKSKISEIIFEAYRGIGEIRLGINITNLSTICEQYRDYLIKTCTVDCYIFTPSSIKSNETKDNFRELFKLLRKHNKYIKFINMYDGENEKDCELTYEIIDEFINNKCGEYLYNMSINNAPYKNAAYLNKVKEECLKTKEGTEFKITNLHSFLQKYDDMIQSKDSYTAEHGRAVCKFSIEIGKKLRLNSRELLVLGIAAALHDIGKYEIDINILTKTKRLTDPEFIQIKNHCLIGKVILDTISFSELTERENEDIELTVEQHHEKFDGTGYPRKIDGTMIHEYSMIVSLADSFHAMLGRSYQEPKSKSDIIKNIRECSGTQFNPKYVEIFCDMLENNIGDLGLTCKDGIYLRYCANQSIAELVNEVRYYN